MDDTLLAEVLGRTRAGRTVDARALVVAASFDADGRLLLDMAEGGLSESARGPQAGVEDVL